MTETTEKISLTLGFTNLGGDQFERLIDKDFAALAPLFEIAKRLPPFEVPGSHVLFVYADLDEDGSIHGTPGKGIRQVAEMSGAGIVVLATPNVTESLIATSKIAGPKKANLVFTLDRKGDGFGRFFRALFIAMQGGKDMLAAWVAMAPQGGSAAGIEWQPGTILAAEAGKVAFPRPKKSGGLFGGNLFGFGKRH